MMAVYAIFLAEIVAYRVGTNYMAKITGNANTYGTSPPYLVRNGPEQLAWHDLVYTSI